jgi:hypothetical protein
MTNVILAAKRTTTDILTSVTVATSAVNQGISSLAHLAEAGATVAGDYRDQVVGDSAARKERYNHSSALNDAHFYLDLKKDIKQDPELEALYEQALSIRKGNAPISIPSTIAAE